MKTEDKEIIIETERDCEGHHHGCRGHKCGGRGALYGLGVIGALFYFLNGVTAFGAIILGIVKAFFWPAFVVFKALGWLQV